MRCIMPTSDIKLSDRSDDVISHSCRATYHRDEAYSVPLHCDQLTVRDRRMTHNATTPPLPSLLTG